jgi:glutaminyl-peptide cyclotransferase
LDRQRLDLRRKVRPHLSVSNFPSSFSWGTPNSPITPPRAHFFYRSRKRHLAEVWATTYLPPHPKRRLISAATPTTPISTIEHLVLIDLLGAPRPHVRSYFPDTAWLFDALVSAESRLRNAGILDAAELGGSFFRARGGGDISLGYMGDDHLPFLRRGVSVLHIIAEPFPRVWHTLGVSVYPPSLPLVIRCALVVELLLFHR